MNKLTITIVVLAACLATTYGLPAEGKATNWPAVAAKVQEIQETVLKNTFEQVKTIASNANQQVGASIGGKVDAAAVTINALLGQINAAVNNQYLTIGQARAVVGEIKATLGRLTGNVQDDLNLLNRAAAIQIRQILGGSFEAVEIQADGLVTLLRD